MKIGVEPRGFQVAARAKPLEEELRHDAAQISLVGRALASAAKAAVWSRVSGTAEAVPYRMLPFPAIHVSSTASFEWKARIKLRTVMRKSHDSREVNCGNFSRNLNFILTLHGCER
jgi:hypothetical protein